MERYRTKLTFLICITQPENLLFREREEDSDLLIADFGLSRIIDTDKFHTLKTTCGTPGYMVKRERDVDGGVR